MTMDTGSWKSKFEVKGPWERKRKIIHYCPHLREKLIGLRQNHVQMICGQFDTHPRASTFHQRKRDMMQNISNWDSHGSDDLMTIRWKFI